MGQPISRRTVLKSMAAGCLAALPEPAEAGRKGPPDAVAGKKTGAAALVAALKTEGVPVVFGIPGRRRTNCGTR